MKSIANIRYVLLIFLLSAAGLSAADSLTSTVDRQTIGKDESLELTLRYSGSSQRGTPDFSLLNNQFEIKSNNRSNHMQSVNGRFTSFTEWTLTLFPKQQGKLLIPSFQYAGEVSDALEITVTEPQQAPKGTLKDVFVETVIDQDSVYVQQQLIVTYRLYYAVNLESVETQPLELENVLKEQLPEARYSRNIKNRRYNIAEFSYALFPQTSGEIRIPSLAWDIKIPKSTSRNKGFFGLSGRYEISRQRTDAKTINVKPRPEAFPKDKPWIPATQVTLSESWSQSPAEFSVGEPSTRTLRLTAKGLMSSQLPQIWPGYEAEAIKSYTDQPELDDEKNDSGVSATRIESSAVVVTQNGTTDLPAIRIPWWDVSSDSLKYAELPALVLTASGGAPENPSQETGAINNPAFAPAPAADSAEFDALKREIRIWQFISALLGILLIITVFIRLSAKNTKRAAIQAPSQTSNEKAAFNALKQACQTNSPGDIRAALIDWARLRWPDSRMTNLSDLVDKIRDSQFEQATSALDAALYGQQDGATIDGEIILAKIQQCAKEEAKNDKPEALQQFYAS